MSTNEYLLNNDLIEISFPKNIQLINDVICYNDIYFENKDNELNCYVNLVTNKIIIFFKPSEYITSIINGDEHTCAISNYNTLKCWGENDYGQTEVPLEFKHNIKQVSLGADHTCAITFAGNLSCWGSNIYGESLVPNV